MRIELTESQAEPLRPLIRRQDEGGTSPRPILGQVMPGDWKAPGKVYLVYTTVSVETASKIRKLIEKERQKSAVRKAAQTND